MKSKCAVCIFLGSIFLAQIVPSVVRYDGWPVSDYAMYAAPPLHGVFYGFRLNGVSPDGELVPLKPGFSWLVWFRYSRAVFKEKNWDLVSRLMWNDLVRLKAEHRYAHVQLTRCKVSLAQAQFRPSELLVLDLDLSTRAFTLGSYAKSL